MNPVTPTYLDNKLSVLKDKLCMFMIILMLPIYIKVFNLI